MEASLLTVSQRWYQELVLRAAHDEQAAFQLFLVQSCLDALKEAMKQDESSGEEITEQMLERLGRGIAQVLPGGSKEFRSYMPEGVSSL